MSEESQRKLLTTRFLQAQVGLPVRMPNTPFKTPTNAAYGEFWIMGSSPPIVLANEGKGKIRQRRVGLIQFNVFVPQGMGSHDATQAADKFAKKFQWRKYRDEDGILYDFKGLQSITPSGSADKVSMVYRIPYWMDEVVEVQIGVG